MAAFKEKILEATSPYNFPILFNADFGHTDPMITIPVGGTCKLDSSRDLFRIEG
jgi:muramoyltetrapeptide carboxypeptidase